MAGRVAAEVHLERVLWPLSETQDRADLLGVHGQGEGLTLPPWRARRGLAGLRRWAYFVLPRSRGVQLSTTIFCVSAIRSFPSCSAVGGSKDPPAQRRSESLAKPSTAPDSSARIETGAPVLNKQLADRGLLVNRANAARQQVGDAEDLDLAHLGGGFRDRHGVGGHHFLDLRRGNALNRRTREHRVSTGRIDLRRAFANQCFRGFHQRARGIDDVVDDQGAAPADISNEPLG